MNGWRRGPNEAREKSGLKVPPGAIRKPLAERGKLAWRWGYDMGIQYRQAYPLPYPSAVCQIPVYHPTHCLHEKVES